MAKVGFGRFIAMKTIDINKLPIYLQLFKQKLPRQQEYTRRELMTFMYENGVPETERERLLHEAKNHGIFVEEMTAEGRTYRAGKNLQ